MVNRTQRAPTTPHDSTNPDSFNLNKGKSNHFRREGTERGKTTRKDFYPNRTNHRTEPRTSQNTPPFRRSPHRAEQPPKTPSSRTKPTRIDERDAESSTERNRSNRARGETEGRGRSERTLTLWWRGGGGGGAGGGGGGVRGLGIARSSARLGASPGTRTGRWGRGR